MDAFYEFSASLCEIQVKISLCGGNHTEFYQAMALTTKNFRIIITAIFLSNDFKICCQRSLDF